MHIVWLISAIVFFIIWVFILVMENITYYKYLQKKKRMEDARKKLEAAKDKKLKWPDDLPHHGL